MPEAGAERDALQEALQEAALRDAASPDGLPEPLSRVLAGVLPGVLGSHAALRYSADDECRALLSTFVRRAVAAGHRVVGLLDRDSAELAGALCAAAAGAAPGQFSALRFGTGDAGFGGPLSSVAEVLDGLARLRDEAFAAGLPGVCVAGEMSWALRAGFTPADLLAYEDRVNRFFADPGVAGLCLYDRRRFPEQLLARVGAVHPGPLLRFAVGGRGAHLRLAGELDASNADALPSILRLVAGADSVVLLDAGELSFVDAAGAGTIVRFAAGRPGRRTVVRCTRGVRQVLRLVGADSVPNLVLRDPAAGV